MPKQKSHAHVSLHDTQPASSFPGPLPDFQTPMCAMASGLLAVRSQCGASVVVGCIQPGPLIQQQLHSLGLVLHGRPVLQAVGATATQTLHQAPCCMQGRCAPPLWTDNWP